MHGSFLHQGGGVGLSASGVGSGVLAASLATLGSSMALRYLQLDTLFYGPVHEVCRAVLTWAMASDGEEQPAAAATGPCTTTSGGAWWSGRTIVKLVGGLVFVLAVLAIVLYRQCKAWRQLTMSPRFARVHDAWNMCLLKAVTKPKLFHGLLAAKKALFPAVDDREFDLLVLRLPDARQTFIDYIKFFPELFASPPEFWHGVANQSQILGTFELFHNTARPCVAIMNGSRTCTPSASTRTQARCRCTTTRSASGSNA
jgi:hypothetical protein